MVLERFLKIPAPAHPRPYGLLGLGLIFGAIDLVRARAGSGFVPLWCALSIVLSAFFFYVDDDARSGAVSFAWKDLMWPAAIVTVLAPFYVAHLYNFPPRINADEIIFINVQKDIFKSKPHDWLGLVTFYYFHPRFMFLLMGKMAQALGGLDVFHMRAAAGTIGLATVGLAYYFFRLTMKRAWAVCATLLLGMNHSLIVLSRMAMWNNSALFLFLLALTLLSFGLMRRSSFWSFWGGVAAGLCFYTYSTARILIFLWPLAWGVRWVFFRRQWPARALWTQVWPAVLGLLLMAQPILWTTHKVGPMALTYSRRQFLVYPEGRDEIRGWYYMKSTKEAVWANIRRGLSAFNIRMGDQGNMYPNMGYPSAGFLDPLTGVLLWMGLVALLIRFGVPFHSQQDLTIAAMFVFCWLFFSFVVNKAPSYPRLLVTLPLVTYLALAGLCAAAQIMKANAAYFACTPDTARRLTLILGLAFAVFLNMRIMGEAYERGFEAGDEWGDTARFLDERKQVQGYHYFMIGDKARPYYYWGIGYWYAWAAGFLGPTQTLSIFTPEEMTKAFIRPPFTLLMSRALQVTETRLLTSRFPMIFVTGVSADGHLVAVEVEPYFVRRPPSPKN